MEVTLNSTTLHILNVCSRTNVITEDLDLASKDLSGSSVVLGDSNLHHLVWGARHSSQNSEAFVDWLTANWYHQHFDNEPYGPERNKLPP